MARAGLVSVADLSSIVRVVPGYFAHRPAWEKGRHERRKELPPVSVRDLGVLEAKVLESWTVSLAL